MGINLKETFDKFDDEFLDFERVESPLSNRPDLHAFLLLDQLCPGDKDMICAAEHDEFWLSIDTDALASVATEEQIRDLIRCGIRFDDDVDSLCMFA